MSADLPDTPARLLRDFQDLDWSSQPMERTLALVEHDPAAALELLLLALRTLSEGATFLDTAVSYVAESDFPLLAATALRTLQAQPGHGVAEDILSHVSLQRPTVLHDFLDPLFELRANQGSYDEAYPWRESGDLHLAFLADRQPSGAVRKKCGRSSAQGSESPGDGETLAPGYRYQASEGPSLHYHPSRGLDRQPSGIRDRRRSSG